MSLCASAPTVLELPPSFPRWFFCPIPGKLLVLGIAESADGRLARGDRILGICCFRNVSVWQATLLAQRWITCNFKIERCIIVNLSTGICSKRRCDGGRYTGGWQQQGTAKQGIESMTKQLPFWGWTWVCTLFSFCNQRPNICSSEFLFRIILYICCIATEREKSEGYVAVPWLHVLKPLGESIAK